MVAGNLPPDGPAADINYVGGGGGGSAPPALQTIGRGTIAGGFTGTANLPTGIQVGDMLIAVLSCGFGGGTTTGPVLPAGWNQVTVGNIGSNPDGRLRVYYRVATGSEGSTVVITGNDAATTYAYEIYRFNSATGVPVGAVSGTSFNANPDPPNLVSGFGAVNTLWLAIGTKASGSAFSAWPSGYSGPIVDTNGAGLAVATAYKTNAAASEDPGTFTIGSAPWSLAATVAIKGT